MRRSGELSFAAWLWESLSPAVWKINIPYYNVSVNPNKCYYSIQLDYPTDGPTYNFNSDGCGPAWIGVDCGYFSCDSVTEGAVVVPFGGGCVPGDDCRDPVNGPLLLNSVDMFLGRNGWNLPCFSQNDACTLEQENPTLGTQRASSARELIESLVSLVRTSVADRATQETLTEPLNAALVVLGPGATQRDFTMSALQNFISLVNAEAGCELPASATVPLTALAHEIRAQLADEAPPEVVYTRPGE
jgi:hypothetical protein